AQKISFTLDASNGEKIGGVKISNIYDDNESIKKIYDPNNPIANNKGYVIKSNINPVSETIKNISAARSYQANIEVLKTVKSMILKVLTLGE
ncbi:flagellar basal body rod protein FlgC, partial [Buchnera aphidicola]|nr:flagellar basal body rod protein FlgC [Buchnera aphidicola]